MPKTMEKTFKNYEKRGVKSHWFWNVLFLRFWCQLASILGLKLRPKKPIGLSWSSKSVQEPSKRPQERPKRVQERPKSGPRVSQGRPRPLPERPKRIQVTPKTAPRAPKSSQEPKTKVAPYKNTGKWANASKMDEYIESLSKNCQNLQHAFKKHKGKANDFGREFSLPLTSTLKNSCCSLSAKSVLQMVHWLCTPTEAIYHKICGQGGVLHCSRREVN